MGLTSVPWALPELAHARKSTTCSALLSLIHDLLAVHDVDALLELLDAATAEVIDCAVGLQNLVRHGLGNASLVASGQVEHLHSRSSHLEVALALVDDGAFGSLIEAYHTVLLGQHVLRPVGVDEVGSSLQLVGCIRLGNLLSSVGNGDALVGEGDIHRDELS